MSLDISKLENVRKRGEKVTARCPACSQAGHDQKGEHLVVGVDGRFACVVYPGDSVDAKEHRKRIFALCGDREIKPLAVQSPGLGRLGRVNQTYLASAPLTNGLLGRLGRVFETHLEPERGLAQDENHNVDERQLNECEKGVLGVPSEQTVTPQRPLSDRERALLLHWCGIDNDSTILEARTLFNATIVGIERSEGRNACMIKACQTEFSW